MVVDRIVPVGARQVARLGVQEVALERGEVDQVAGGQPGETAEPEQVARIALGEHPHDLDPEPRHVAEQIVELVGAAELQLQLPERLRGHDRLVHVGAVSGRVARGRLEHAAVGHLDVRAQVRDRLHAGEHLGQVVPGGPVVVHVVQAELAHGGDDRHPQRRHQALGELPVDLADVGRAIGLTAQRVQVDLQDGGARIAPGARLLALQVAGEQALQHPVGVHGRGGQQRHAERGRRRQRDRQPAAPADAPRDQRRAQRSTTVSPTERPSTISTWVDVDNPTSTDRSMRRSSSSTNTNRRLT